MRIDNNNPLDPFFAAEAAKARPAKTDQAKTAFDQAGVADAGQTKALIAQAQAVADVRPQAIADAKHLLKTGQLESDPSIDRLVERLTELGI